MGDDKKQSKPASPSEHMSRMSFLYKVSRNLLRATKTASSALDTGAGKRIPVKIRGGKKLEASEAAGSLRDLSRLILSRKLSGLMVGIGRKTVSRHSPEVKRTICKTCRSVLVPSGTFRPAQIRSKDKFLRVQCTVCSTVKQWPLQKKNPCQ